MNKLLTILIAITLLVISGISLFSKSERNTHFMKANGKQSKIPVMKYTFSLVVNSDIQASAQKYDQLTTVEISANVLLSPVYEPDSNTYEIFIEFEKLELYKISTKSNEQFLEQVLPSENSETKIIDIYYRAIVEADSGQLISLQKAESFEISIVDHAIQDMIKQIFPDLNKFEQKRDNLLTESVESVDFGEAKVNYDIEWQGNEEVITKSYDDEDLVKNKFDLGGEVPEVNYKVVTYLNEGGVVKKSVETYSIEVGNHLQYTLEQSDNQQEAQGYLPNDSKELLGKISVSLKSQCELTSIEYQSLDETVVRIGSKVRFPLKMVNLEANSGSVSVNDRSDEAPEIKIEADAESDSSLLGQSQLVYQREYDIFSKSFLGQTVGLQAQYRNYNDKSSVQAHIMLNYRSIKSIFDITFNHCGLQRQSNQNKNFEMRVFRADFPVAAIITIPVMVDVQINYGFDFYYGGSNQGSGCMTQFKPFFRPGIVASGGVSVKLAEGGVYARGNVANTYLTFQAEIRGFPPNLQGKADLTVTVKPFEYDVGAWYQHITCNLIQLITLQWKEVCTTGQKNYIPFINGASNSVYTLYIFNWSWKK